MLSSSEVKTQRTALDCLIKSGYHRGLLHKYQKLLDGFIDDEKFKDMISIAEHGSQGHSAEQVTDENQDVIDEDGKLGKKLARKETKSVIPKLEDQDRSLMLPLIIKILQSKLQQKRGAINKKSLYVRRNIIYQFYATLNPETEFAFVINQLLEPIGLTIADTNTKKIQAVLSTVSLNQHLTFVNQLEVMVKQMGKLLRDAVGHLSTVLVTGVIKLVKVFLDGDVAEDGLEEEDEDGDQGQQSLHQGAKKQAKNCLRKSLGLVNEIFKKFSDEDEFIGLYSDQVFEYIVQD